MQRLALSCGLALAILIGLVLTFGNAAAAGPPVRAGTPSSQKLHAPDERESFDFMVFGDRTGGPAEGIKVLADGVQMANRLDVDFVLTVGDLVQGYNQGDEWLAQMREYKATMAGLNMPWYPVAGNHDVYARPHQAGGNMDLYKQHFGPLYYSFDYKWAHFIALFSDEHLSFRDPAVHQIMSREQMAWLRADLESTGAGQIFVFLHHPRWTEDYAGCKWNDVHRIFVEDGRPTTVFAGHVHLYRDDGRRDNVHYRTLATTGGRLTRFQQTASIHHVDFVRVRPESVAVAVLPIGNVLAGDFVLGEEVEMMKRLARGGWLEVTGETVIGLNAGQRSAFDITLSNPTDRAVRIGGSITGGEGWMLKCEPASGTLGAGEKLTFTAFAIAPALEDAQARLTVNARADYTLRSGLTEPIETQVAVPIRIQVPDREARAEPGNNGVLTLDGSSAVRVDIPEQLERYTLECWVRGQQPAGRVALLSKTERSAYGIFWSDEGGGHACPVGYVGTSAGYVAVPAAEGWPWDRWTHVALVFDGRRAAFYVNGRLRAESTTEAAVTHNRHPLYVGADPGGDGSATSFFTGQIDEVRLSNVARYTTTFKPRPVFERDGSTLLLLHFDRRFGRALLDDSGTGHHGWSVGEPQIERVNR